MLPIHRRHRTTKLAIALVMVLITLLPGIPGITVRASTLASTSAPTSAPDASSPFGVAGVMRWPDWGSFSRPVDAMLDTGGTWVREDFAWGLIEPRQGQFDWTATDRIAGALRVKGLNILGIISYSAAWATPTKDDDGASPPISMYPPDLKLYYNFVHALVSHYKGSVSHWEVWNEPNNGIFWKPEPNARQYADLLKTAYKAIKDADPGSTVLNGGVNGNAIPFLEEMEAAGAGDSYDVLAIHPYATPLDPAKGRMQSMPEVYKTLDIEMNKYHAFLQRHGHNRPIWITEIGWPAADWSLDENFQADYLAQAYALILSSGLAQRVFWYSFKDDAASGHESWGLVRWGKGQTDLEQRRPSFAAYSTSAKMLTGVTPAGRIQLGQYATIEGFEQQGNWARSTNPEGAFAVSTEQKHSGTSSGKLSYNFTGSSQAVDFAPPAPVTLPGNPTRLGLWVLGDASGNYISIWLRDRDGELFKVRLGAVTGAADGWRYYESRIQNYYYDWEKAGGNPANGTPDYPLQFVSVRLENTPDEPSGAGAIYLDDLQSFDGPDATALRFNRPGGEVVDVLWSANPTEVTLPTGASAQVVTRDGTKTVDASNGLLTLKLGSNPTYVVHKQQKLGATEPAAGPVQPGAKDNLLPGAGTLDLCGAAVQAKQVADPDNRYFPETNHNLTGAFRRYWEANGSVTQLGYPITDVFAGKSSDGKTYTQQLFERARMEYHPESKPPDDVQLGLLGVWVTDGRALGQAKPASPGAMTFPETGQSLDLFKAEWSSNGGLPIFGFPISGELQERNPADGKTYTVQYFQRNRMEYHPEYQGTPREVMLGLLGVEYLTKQACK
ncbi:MAG: glycosyl hydrolase [Chloroflexota bacterium]